MTHKLFQDDCLAFLRKHSPTVDCIFSDQPDNLGLAYDGVADLLPPNEYLKLMFRWVNAFIQHSPIVWFSFNSRYTFEMGEIFLNTLRTNIGWLAQPCVQTFTFGNYNPNGLTNCYRPLWVLYREDAKFYPEQIRIKSWRLEHGDARANPNGKVPGDVFDFTRVTGNSSQRRPYHPTQLNEGLVARCIKYSTLPGQRVLDPFGGTGTTLRVCKAYDRLCTIVEMSPAYCGEIAREHRFEKVTDTSWQLQPAKRWW